MARQLPTIYLLIGFLEIIGELLEIRWMVWGLKPLLMPILLGYYWLSPREPSAPDLWISGALIASWFGDVFLMLDTRYFELGLGSFLVAQIAYMVVYARSVDGSSSSVMGRWQSLAILGLLLAYGSLLVAYIYPHLGERLIPVVVYACALVGMVWWAYLRNGRTSRTSYLLVFLGAVLFLVSDSMIALARFGSPFDYSRLWIMLTYILAQFFIVNGILAHYRKEG